MKKLLSLMLVCCLGLFAIGCDQAKTDVEKAKDDAAVQSTLAHVERMSEMALRTAQHGADLKTMAERDTRNMDEGSGAVRETTFSVDVGKRITDNFGIGFGATYVVQKPDDGDTQRGWDNVSLSAKYVFYQNIDHEAIVSAGISPL